MTTHPATSRDQNPPSPVWNGASAPRSTSPGPQVELDERYGEPGVSATPWSEARQVLHDAEISWLSTVRPDGRPHVTPLITVWVAGAAYFCTGADELKARNLADHPGCILTTGTNLLASGLDVVVEGRAQRVQDGSRLRVVADNYLDKYGDEWRFEVTDGGFRNVAGGFAVAFELVPEVAFAFRRGPYSQTRYRF